MNIVICSNGLDLEGIAVDENYAVKVVGLLEQLLLKMYELPCASIAAINGHAFAGR